MISCTFPSFEVTMSSCTFPDCQVADMPRDVVHTHCSRAACHCLGHRNTRDCHAFTTSPPVAEGVCTFSGCGLPHLDHKNPSVHNHCTGPGNCRCDGRRDLLDCHAFRRVAAGSSLVAQRPRAVYAGSFDPPTHGHRWVAEQARRLFGRDLVVAVAHNPAKRYALPVEQRVALLQVWGVQVVVLGDALLAPWAQKQGIQYLVRGVRNAADAAYEQAMRHVNADAAPGVETVFLMPPRHLCEVSSSLVKGLIGVKGGAVLARNYADPHVVQALKEALCKPQPQS